MHNKSQTCHTKEGKKRNEYDSAVSAQEHAEYLKNQGYAEQQPYHCNVCHLWHLCPKDRHTKSKTCDYCTDSNNRSKQLYATKEDAQRRKEIIFNERGKELQIYKCDYSSGYHLTSGGY